MRWSRWFGDEREVDGDLRMSLPARVTSIENFIRLEERVFISQIFSHVSAKRSRISRRLALIYLSPLVSPRPPHSRLMKHNDTRRVQLPCVDRTPRRYTESQWGPTHAQHHDARMLGRVVRNTTQVGLDDVPAVEEGELSVRLDPDLVLCVSG